MTEKVVDEKTDIYNFGATMYRMFTGRFANRGSPRPATEGPASSPRPIQINPKIPGTLNETIMACLEISPDRRPAGMFEIKHQLAAVAKHMGLEEVDLQGAEDDETEPPPTGRIMPPDSRDVRRRPVYHNRPCSSPAASTA